MNIMVRLQNLVGIICLFFVSATFGQTIKMEGFIKNSEGEIIANATVKCQGTNSVVKSDERGYYLLQSIPIGKQYFQINASGYETFVVALNLAGGETFKHNFLLEPFLLEIIDVVGKAENQFYKDSNATVGKLPLKNLENPQVYNSIPKELLKEQVVTEFNDAMKNATGVTRLWESTGRGGDGAEYYSMRGFSVQPTMVNGVPGLNNGAIDPANVETIDVIKGPSGTLFGSSVISYGGLINVTTKKPYEKLGGNFGYVLGSNGQNRLTGDLNIPLNNKTSVRINTAYADQNSFQDAGFRKSFYFAPSFKLKASEKLTFLINTEFQNAQSANAPMLFLNRYGPLSYSSLSPFEKFYKRSFTSNDLAIKNPNFNLQGQALYKINQRWSSQTIVSSSTSKSSGYYHYFWDFGDGNTFGRYISKRNGETQTVDLQQNFIGDFKVGKIRNRLVVGLDYYEANVLNSSTGWVLNGLLTVADGMDSGNLTQIGVDSLLVGTFEGVSKARTQVASAYFSDVVNITPKLSAMVSVRLDNFRNNDFAATTEKSQSSFSPKFGLVYQPILNKVSIFGNYMNGFVNQAPTQVSDADGSNVRMQSLNPEQANQYEFGVKTNLWTERIALTASYYNIMVSNKVMSDPNNINGIIQGGKVESKGIEISLVANPIKGLNLIAGFSDNQSKVVEDNPENGYLGLRPEEAGPAQLINFWVNYSLPFTKLKGLGIGFGGNVSSKHMTLHRAVTGTFTLPGYEVFNAALSYKSNNYSVILKMNNLMNTRYYAGWSTITAQQLRTVSLGFNYNF
jgi:iron complex outermembrane receptor protein